MVTINNHYYFVNAYQYKHGPQGIIHISNSLTVEVFFIVQVLGVKKIRYIVFNVQNWVQYMKRKSLVK
jgi:hypothetical protein